MDMVKMMPQVRVSGAGQVSRPLTGLLLPILVLFSLVAGSADAVPLFCSDLDAPPGRYLTGCRIDDGAAHPMAPTFVVTWTPVADSGAVDAMLAERSRTNSLVQVGAIGLGPEDQDDREDPVDTPATPSEPADVTQAGGTADKSILSALEKRDRWYFMDIDQDGTYILLGDPAEQDEWRRTEDDEYLFPKGIGIGKRWRF